MLMLYVFSLQFFMFFKVAFLVVVVGRAEVFAFTSLSLGNGRCMLFVFRIGNDK